MRLYHLPSFTSEDVTSLILKTHFISLWWVSKCIFHDLFVVTNNHLEGPAFFQWWGGGQLLWSAWPWNIRFFLTISLTRNRKKDKRFMECMKTSGERCNPNVCCVCRHQSLEWRIVGFVIPLFIIFLSFYLCYLSLTLPVSTLSLLPSEKTLAMFQNLMNRYSYILVYSVSSTLSTTDAFFLSDVMILVLLSDVT